MHEMRGESGARLNGDTHSGGVMMIAVCIYQRNRGLGKCVGPVSRVKVASRQLTAWRGLHHLAERLKAAGEEPGVCQAHEQRAGENGYLLDVATAAPQKRTTRRPRGTPAATPPTKRASHSDTGDA